MDVSMEVTALVGPIISSFKLLNNEIKNLMDEGLERYILLQTEKLYFTNTFIHNKVKVRFFDIYYPIKASYGKVATNFSNIDEILQSFRNISISGFAGSGKSMVLRHIFFRQLELGSKIPIILELRYLTTTRSFESQVIEKIGKLNIKPSLEILKRALEKGSFLFLLDGFDEISTDRKNLIVNQIDSFVNFYSKNNFVVTTRAGAGIDNHPNFYHFRMHELSNSDVDAFTKKMLDSDEVYSKIMASIMVSPTYNSYLKNPLLLSMYISAFEYHPEVPAKKSAFYRNVFDTLYSRHDGVSKYSFMREKRSNLQKDDFEAVLRAFSYISYFQQRYSFTYEYFFDTLIRVRDAGNVSFVIDDLIYDLRISISVLILDGFEYSFPHRSLQEYFASQFISKLATEKKRRAYIRLTKHLSGDDIDIQDYEAKRYFKLVRVQENEHLLSLLFEVDRIDFFSMIAVPRLEEFMASYVSKHAERTLIVDDPERRIELILQLDNFIKSFELQISVEYFDSYINVVFRSTSGVWSMLERVLHLPLLSKMAYKNLPSLSLGIRDNKHRGEGSGPEDDYSQTQKLLGKISTIDLMQISNDVDVYINAVNSAIVNCRAEIERSDDGLDGIL